MDIDTKQVKEKVDSGEYFAESRRFYGMIYHMPIAERSQYLVIIVLALLVFFVSLQSFMSIFPLTPNIPFVISSGDVYEEIPRMEKLARGDEDKNQSVIWYLIRNYVERREFYHYYKPKDMERNYNNIKFHSTRDVLLEYRQMFETKNAASPYNIYANQTARTVGVRSIRWVPIENGYQARVEFTEKLVGKRRSTSPEWIADLTFTYSPFEVEQDIKELTLTNFISIAWDVYNNPEKYSHNKKFRVKPMKFTVTSYTTKPKLTEQ